MSSIDKYVETYAKEVDSSVSVTKSGGMIIGRIRGREVFRIKDRYGYLSDSERKQIREEIQRYRAGVEAELRAERERKERQEREAAERAVSAEIASKLSRIAESERGALAHAESQKEICAAAERKLAEIVRGVPLAASASSLEGEIRDRKVYYESRASEIASVASENRKRLERLAAEVKGASKSQCEAYRAEARRTGIEAVGTVGSVSFDDKLSAAENNARKLKGIAEAVKMLESYVKAGEVPAAALRGLEGVNLCDGKAVNEAIRAVTARLDEIAVLRERTAKEAERGELVKLQQNISACRKLSHTAENSTYEIRDYSQEIELAARAALAECANLRELGYCVLRESEIRAAEDGVTALARGINSEDTLDALYRETEKLRSAAAESARLERTDYAAYRKLKEELAALGMEEIPEFDAKNSSAQIAGLENKRVELYEAAAPARLALCEQQVQIAMEACGYRLLTAFRDGKNRVWENIYALPSYPDAVYQVIYFPDGSFRRRLLGVNRCGATQTSKEYLRAVARKLEESHEADEMIAAISGGKVTKSVEYTESITDEELTSGGYFYIETEEQLAAYEEAIGNASASEGKAATAPTVKAETKRKHSVFDGFTTVDIVDRSSAVKSSAATLRQAALGKK